MARSLGHGNGLLFPARDAPKRDRRTNGCCRSRCSHRRRPARFSCDAGTAVFPLARQRVRNRGDAAAQRRVRRSTTGLRATRASPVFRNAQSTVGELTWRKW
ncbi:Uncharacterised protein [Amycolatopsis camponoti]|uniref:Uncharacterized protein n=1 Tax=Amycolatopsis camponoti TaxID=2606593 RepID=A0A6I8LTS4_9PSEU|nr:Uncharacterised protein [Amycolatopsis camponoti]